MLMEYVLPEHETIRSLQALAEKCDISRSLHLLTTTSVVMASDRITISPPSGLIRPSEEAMFGNHPMSVEWHLGEARQGVQARGYRTRACTERNE
jgi:hypothetical protein